VQRLPPPSLFESAAVRTACHGRATTLEQPAPWQPSSASKTTAPGSSSTAAAPNVQEKRPLAAPAGSILCPKTAAGRPSAIHPHPAPAKSCTAGCIRVIAPHSTILTETRSRSQPWPWGKIRLNSREIFYQGNSGARRASSGSSSKGRTR